MATHCIVCKEADLHCDICKRAICLGHSKKRIWPIFKDELDIAKRDLDIPYEENIALGQIERYCNFCWNLLEKKEL